MKCSAESSRARLKPRHRSSRNSLAASSFDGGVKPAVGTWDPGRQTFSMAKRSDMAVIHGYSLVYGWKERREDAGDACFPARSREAGRKIERCIVIYITIRDVFVPLCSRAGLRHEHFKAKCSRSRAGRGPAPSPCPQDPASGVKPASRSPGD